MNNTCNVKQGKCKLLSGTLFTIARFCGIRNIQLEKKYNRRAGRYSSALQPLPGCTFMRAQCAAPAWFGIIMAALVLFSSPAHAISGREAYEKAREVHIRGLTHRAQLTMSLYDRGGGKRTRSFVLHNKKGAEREAYKTLIVFMTPADLKNVGFLIQARTFAVRDMWAYFPDYKRIRRIPATSQDDSFFGSDFSYDDFGGPPNLDDYKFEILREEVVDGLPCYVVEVTPKIQRKFTRFISWMAKDLWIPVKIEFYEETELYRIALFQDIKIIDDIPTPFTWKMENKKNKHRTDLLIENIEYNPVIPDDLFTQRSLERGGK